jgi:hypothetical protein
MTVSFAAAAAVEVMVRVTGTDRFVGAVVLTVEVRVAEFWLSEQETPVGAPAMLQARFTVPEKVFAGVT